MTPMELLREKIVDFLRWELIGPDSGDEELDESPIVRYSAGALFPGGHIIDENEDVEESAGPPPEENDSEPGWVPGKAGESAALGQEDTPDAVLDTPVQLASAHYPSAMGLSFICRTKTALKITVQGATYARQKEEPSEGRSLWRRTPICKQVEPQGPVSHRFVADPGEKRFLVLPQHTFLKGLALHVTVRRRENDRCLVTVAIWNCKKQADKTSRPDPADCFFQVGFRVECDAGVKNVLEYRLGSFDSDDAEEKQLRLLYRERGAFAIGHGCAPDWPNPEEVTDGAAAWIATAVMPRATVLPLEAASQSGDHYRMDFLAGQDGAITSSQIAAALRQLPQAYELWLKERQLEAASLAPEFAEAAEHNLGECKKCLTRIQSGVDLLANDDQCMNAFMLANRAMLLQQLPDLRKHALKPDAPKPMIPEDKGKWRVFQLAFVLMNLRSIAGGKLDPDGERSLVDLIWFPTGGGKTEAYLGLTAFTIFLRRLRKPRDHGCAALMRYTLRLLTSQQFERAAALITACDYIRRQSRGALGIHPITIGLWAGDKLTPNKRASAITLLRDWSGGEGHNPFQLLKCPWCWAKLDDRLTPGYYQVGKGLQKTVRFACPDATCPMSRKNNPDVGIPALVIDEDIYEQPPSLLVGTVDKFAMLAWNDQAGILLTGDGADIGPPDLIIQDELHLISGPLGTIVGLYEAAIDRLCQAAGHAPKIVASTATIRRAEEQCRNLFDRKTSIFPPAALSIRDSWFATERSEKTGRLYIGVFGTAAPSYTTLLRQAIAALTFAASWVSLPSGLAEAARDPYWTLIWYFNSLRALGRGGTMIDADIREHFGVIRRRLRADSASARRYLKAEELNSRRRGEEIPEILRRLEAKHPESADALDVLLATNMISVGVDVPRLGLMAVTGQPKTTAEYIQATSRVGRNSEKGPGLVLALFGPGKSRDRSHYEQFRAYHESFYRFVEPTSVTPFSIPALDRALHALIVIIARQHPAARLGKPNELTKSAAWLTETLGWLVKRANNAGTDQAYVDAMKARFKFIVDLWISRGRPEWGKANAKKEDGEHLLLPSSAAINLKEGTPGSAVFDVPFPTPTSMRSVDVECRLRVMDRAYAPGHVVEGDDDGEE